MTHCICVSKHSPLCPVHGNGAERYRDYVLEALKDGAVSPALLYRNCPFRVKPNTAGQTLHGLVRDGLVTMVGYGRSRKVRLGGKLIHGHTAESATGVYVLKFASPRLLEEDPGSEYDLALDPGAAFTSRERAVKAAEETMRADLNDDRKFEPTLPDHEFRWTELPANRKNGERTYSRRWSYDSEDHDIVAVVYEMIADQ